MRISDWSSDVCSSDLVQLAGGRIAGLAIAIAAGARAGQRQALFNLCVVFVLHQLVKKTADLARVAGNFADAFLGGVEFLEHHHRDEQIMLFEAEKRGRIVEEDVGIDRKSTRLNSSH